MAESANTTFMTGATGLLGHFILRELLLRERRVVAMLRPPLAASRRRLRELMLQLGVRIETHLATDQLVLTEGDLPEDLPEGRWGRTDDILSCAASLQLFANGNAEPYRTNVAGTESLIKWAQANRVGRIHAVSTAYVCGSYTEAVGEVFHHPRPEFHTEYERSKWLAEMKLSEWVARNGNVLTITRPSILVGDSQSGYTTQFGGFYQLARMIAILKEQYGNGNGEEPTYVPLRIPGRPDDPQNFVPVDFAARMIATLVLDETLHGRIYHLTDPFPPTNAHLKRCLEDYFNICGGYFVAPERINGNHSRAEALVWKGYDVATPRVTHNPVFHQENTRDIMQTTGLEFPSLDRDCMFRLLDFAVANRWAVRATRGLAEALPEESLPERRACLSTERSNVAHASRRCFHRLWRRCHK